jgi:hypothetical protein
MQGASVTLKVQMGRWRCRSRQCLRQIFTERVDGVQGCGEFGRRLYAETWQRGWARAEKKVVLGDGAEWIWNQANLYFSEAAEIVDLYHAREHLWSLGAKLYPNDSPAQKCWVMVRKDKLDEGKIERLVALMRSQAASHPPLRA